MERKVEKGKCVKIRNCLRWTDNLCRHPKSLCVIDGCEVRRAPTGRYVNNPGCKPRDKRNTSNVLAEFLTRRASKIVTKPKHYPFRITGQKTRRYGVIQRAQPEESHYLSSKIEARREKTSEISVRYWKIMNTDQRMMILEVVETERLLNSLWIIFFKKIRLYINLCKFMY